MGYYHIELSAKYKELCSIFSQWGKYKHQQTPMVLCNSLDIFQEKMSEFFFRLDTVLVYNDDLLHVTKGSWEGFCYGTTLDLNMGYYQIELSAK